MTRLPDVLRGLSLRVQGFSGISLTGNRFWRPSDVPYIGRESRWQASPETQCAAEEFDGEYGGIKIAVLGGPLDGVVEFGVRGPDFVWRSQQGVEMFKCASHPTLQCAIVRAVDLRVGSSWSRDFNPIFDSVELFIEDSAMWGSLQGWFYAAVGALSVEDVLDAFPALVRDETASGVLSAWWLSHDIAVAVHPYLSPGRGPDPQVAILVRAMGLKDPVRRALREIGISASACDAGEIYGAVPRLTLAE